MLNFTENDLRNEEHKDKMKVFLRENKEFIENNVVSSFLSQKRNKELLIDAICNPTGDNKTTLDKEFKKFYFNIRFISFISTTLHYNAINFDKRFRKISKRYPLTVDTSILGQEGMSFKEMIEDINAEIKIEDIVQSKNIEDYIVDDVLFEALKHLTDKQKQVINLAYIHGYSDTEISKRLKKSQQAISKLHKKALESIHHVISQGKGDI